jgi:hypothetical protein
MGAHDGSETRSLAPGCGGEGQGEGGFSGISECGVQCSVQILESFLISCELRTFLIRCELRTFLIRCELRTLNVELRTLNFAALRTVRSSKFRVRGSKFLKPSELS